MEITNDMVEYSYLMAKKVLNRNLGRSEGVEYIVRDKGMNTRSASAYITVFLDMMAGNEYRRTINNYATEYYVDNIRKDFGEEAFRRAIRSIDMHTKYYAAQGKGNLRGIEDIVLRYKSSMK